MFSYLCGSGTAQVSLSMGDSPFLRVLAFSSIFWTVSSISQLSSAGRQLLWRSHGFIPSFVLYNDPRCASLGSSHFFSLVFPFAVLQGWGVLVCPWSLLVER
jgi:hypothetical protein